MTRRDSGLLVDTGFFIALYDERDGYHSDARAKADWLECLPIVIPWPVLYETINTRFSRRREIMSRFQLIVDSPNTVLVDDAPYRIEAYRTVLARTRLGDPLSLVDSVLRSVIEDANIAIGAMLTYNPRDFAEVCSLHRVELL